MRPEALIVGRATTDAWTRFLHVLEPGTSARLELASIRIEWEGPVPATGAVNVFCRASGVNYDSSFAARAQMFEPEPFSHFREWNAMTPLLIEAIPVHVNGVSFEGIVDSRVALPVSLSKGRTTTVRMSAEIAEALQAAEPND